jgi:hypothetical protein
MMKKIGQFLSTPLGVKLLLTTVVVGLMLFILVGSLTQHSPPLPSAPSADQGGSAGENKASVNLANNSRPNERESKPVVTASNHKAGVTYLPGVQRPAKQRPGDLSMISDMDTQWWLLAESEAGVRWLDQLGFPTPAEERFLFSASDAELSRLVENGDLNAKALLATREAKKAFASGKLAEAERAAFAQDTALRHLAGPYQAIVIAKGFAEMIADYRELPESEKTEERKAILKLYNYREQVASLVATAYGDSSVDYLRNIMNLRGVQQEVGWQISDTGSLERSSSVLAASARWRAANGMPPLIIVPQPIPNASIPRNERVIFERY